jgi:hypothetical protein
MNELDSKAHSRAIDALLNYETVKYFNNERWEHDRYDEQMQKWEAAQIRSQISLSWLNLGQSLIIAAAVTLMMWRAAVEVVAGKMTVGDIVLVNGIEEIGIGTTLCPLDEPDALPLLKAAAEVHVLTVSGEKDVGGHAAAQHEVPCVSYSLKHLAW